MDRPNLFDITETNIDKKEIKEKINRYRRQILIHSCIYQRMNTNIISNYEYDKRCQTLVELQTKYPDIADECDFAEAFKDFEGDTGFNLPLGNYWVRSKAYQLLNNPYVKQNKRSD